MRKFSMLAVVSAVLVSVFFLGLPAYVSAKDIKVGFVCNLTGPASSWGQFHAKGQKDYTRYVNDLKGGIAGQKIDLTVVDHAYKVPEGLKYVKMFCAQDHVDMLATWDAGSRVAA